jgi:hypothetical protein
LLKILSVNKDSSAAQFVDALNNAAPGSKEEELWKYLEDLFLASRAVNHLRSIVASCDLCPRLRAIYASVIEAERQNKKKKAEKEYFNAMVSLYFSGREESSYGEKPGAILDELISNKLISEAEFFAIYIEQKHTNYTIPDEAAEYAFTQYKAAAEAFTAVAGKLLAADACLEWLTFTENKLPVLAYVPVLNSASKKVVDRAEKIILAAPASEWAAIIEAVSVALPKLKKNEEAAAERILVLLKSKK